MLKLRSRRLTPVVLTAAMVLSATCAAFAQYHDDRDDHNNRDNRITTAAAQVKHVFVIVLENKNFSDTFETSTQDPYLQKTLVPEGALLTQYFGTGHVSLDNYISMISG